MGLVGVTDMQVEMSENLGVKLTLPKIYQMLSTIGYLFTVIGHFTIRHSPVGRVFLTFNMLFTLAYAYMIYLTFVYNNDLDPAAKSFDFEYYLGCLLIVVIINLPDTV